MVGQRIYTMPIKRELDVDLLAIISDEEADNGEENGLQCNRQYQDLRGISWDQVEYALEREEALFQRFASAADLDEEADLYAGEHEEAILPEEDLWGLDVGVIGATLASIRTRRQCRSAAAMQAVLAATMSRCSRTLRFSFLEPWPQKSWRLPKKQTSASTS